MPPRCVAQPAHCRFPKKGAGSASVTYAEALDGALAWGWIDGQKDTFNDAWWLQRFTPRTTRAQGFPGAVTGFF
jgi:uncharacterized protein YdeI (YjbR/CyaY-like superfamily)